ncbi:uncharacterized protein [Coffea arabica]|uniref:RNase H type-1 domain-containing protein n=1 Tax=Coffea arabica TaxID=13443 RepID=A0ABM4U0Z4_COFAR
MRVKYCRDLHPCQVQLIRCVLGTWRRMLNISRQVEFSLVWQVQDGGSCHFWYDNWLGSGALFLKATVNPVLSFKDFIVNGKWSSHLLSRVLPLDLLPSMPSKCFCCPNGATETVEHVFSEGQLAKAVWNCFASMCGLTQVGSSLRARVVAWWMSPLRAEKRRLLFTMIPSFICWHIWRARNGVAFKGTRMQSANICQAVISDITSGLENQFSIKLGWVSFPQLYDWSGQQGGGIRVELVRWRAKEMGCLTLNTDGCFKGNPRWSGNGRVLRDSLGRPIMAFSAFFGKSLSLHAEALALLTDFSCVWRRGSPMCRYNQIPREANRVADILANMGVSHQHQPCVIYEHIRTFPKLARGEVRLDRLGMSSVRRIKGASGTVMRGGETL